CGTDLEIARGYMGFRGIPGHEFVGYVVETTNDALRGRRVVGEINAACGRCEMCKKGLGRHCPTRTVLGILNRDGAFAEMLRLPDVNLIPIPDSIPDEVAVFTEPIAAAYEILDQARPQLESPQARTRTLVVGDGRLGATVAMVLAAEGILVEVSGRHREKLEQIANLHENIVASDNLEIRAGRPYPVVIDCTGSPSGFDRALELVEPRGTIILKSTAHASKPINLAPVVVNEITVIGSRCGRFEPALDALRAGKIDPRPLISGTFDLKDAADAFAAAAKPPNFKILLKAA
ncbi:MAG TPA: alcohol dehydrogenase catalytic domain-containing protein, partial [Candidatus Binataceae bacterium]|nr:alcohol dehydrogenase catalytic domain-containing protein [Candidatus Binataceae bacterium]